MAAETGNTNICDRHHRSSPVNLGPSMTASLQKVYRGDCDKDRQSEMAVCLPKSKIFYFQFSIGDIFKFFLARCGRKPPIWRWNFNAVCHSFQYLGSSSLSSPRSMFPDLLLEKNELSN